MTPILSIIVPSRNRQKYCIKTIDGILRSRSANDFEIIVCDNSDDVDLLPELIADQQFARDSRLVVLTEDSKQKLSMRANWEKGLAHSTGNWVCFIGDDDHVDPNAITLLNNIEREYPETEYVRPSKLLWSWPDFRPHETTIQISLSSGMKKMNNKKMLERLRNYKFENRPEDGYSPYHAFTRRSLIHRMEEKFGRFFVESNVDYFTGWLMSNECTMAIYSARPLSVHGASRASNSGALRNARLLRERHEQTLTDLKSDEIPDKALLNFAVDHPPTLTEYIFELRKVFFVEYLNEAVPVADKDYLVAALRRELEASEDDFTVSIRKQNISKFLEWNGLSECAHKLEGCVRVNMKNQTFHTGEFGGDLYVKNDFCGAKTPYEFYSIVNQLLRRIDQIGKEVAIKKIV